MYKKMIITVFILLGLLLISSPYIKGGIIAYLSKSQSESALTVEQLKKIMREKRNLNLIQSNRLS